jgi:hypothetical protein
MSMTSVRLLCLEIRATQKDCVLFVTQYSSVTQNSFLLVQSIVPSQSHSYASFLSITISTELVLLDPAPILVLSDGDDDGGVLLGVLTV